MAVTNYSLLLMEYEKDGSGDDGEDCGWVDYVQWTGSAPPPPPPPPPSPLAEGLDSDLSYTTGGVNGNFVKCSDPFYCDGDATRSIALSHSEEAWLQTTVDANSGDKISFYWKVSSEVYDYLEFYIDEGTYEHRISGDVDWQKKTYTLSSGSHTLKWRFIRNSSGDGGENCGWVDFVQWTQPSPVQNPENWNTITYEYDPSGRRIEKDVDGYKTTYVYDGGNVIAEYDGNNNLTRKYIHGARVDELVCMIDVVDSNAVYYYHYDALGSVVALSDSAGDSCQSYEYSVYGQVAASDPNFIANPYMFTGRRFDYETGLYYYRARYYNPYIGRFLQTDPVGYGGGINWYAYCGNNPLNFMDPSGLRKVTDEELGYLYKIRDSLSELVEKGYGSDVEALAYLSDCVVVYSGSESGDVDDYIDAFMNVASFYLYDGVDMAMLGSYVAGDVTMSEVVEEAKKDNPNYPAETFSDSGFKEEYKQERPASGTDQFTHFVGFMGAGFLAPSGCIAKHFLDHWEDGERNADYRLGLAAIEIGEELKDYYITGGPQLSPFSPIPHGMRPDEVGDWIRENLKQ